MGNPINSGCRVRPAHTAPKKHGVVTRETHLGLLFCRFQSISAIGLGLDGLGSSEQLA